MELLKNPVLISVALLLILSAIRLNVVFSLIIAAMVGGLAAGMNGPAIMAAFSSGLKGGANIAFNYAMLGAFSIAISRSGVTELLARELFKFIGREVTPKQLFRFKYLLLLILTLAAVSSQNVIPIHIAFIPILIPPLLPVFERLKLDRRMVACILTFGLITPYMVLPAGFGRIYLNEILIGGLNGNGLKVTSAMAPKAMLIPALGMVAGLLIAIFFSYRKPREYNLETTLQKIDEPVEIKPRKVIAGFIAIAVGLAGQLWLDSLVIASLLGILVFVLARVISLQDTQDVFTRGVSMMGGIGIIMIAAAGFASVMKATGSVESLVRLVSAGIGDQRGLAVFLMLLIGLII
ncbi:MAG: sodium:proton antiporter, partial [Lentisphaeria bacterium]|nr:sodium:proton antiporter [Lentisphaeria bacterium]